MQKYNLYFIYIFHKKHQYFHNKYKNEQYVMPTICTRSLPTSPIWQHLHSISARFAKNIILQDGDCRPYRLLPLEPPFRAARRAIVSPP